MTDRTGEEHTMKRTAIVVGIAAALAVPSAASAGNVTAQIVAQVRPQQTAQVITAQIATAQIATTKVATAQRSTAQVAKLQRATAARAVAQRATAARAVAQRAAAYRIAQLRRIR
jgi:hypothetical protein